MRFHCPVLKVLLFHPFISEQEQICTEVHLALFAHLRVWRLPQEVILQRQSRNYTQMCSSSKELFTNGLDKCHISKTLRVGEFYWCY